MKSFIAFSKKEIFECVRTGKFTILGLLFLIFGIMNPAIAKLTPWMLGVLSNSLAGKIVTEVTVNALTSWTQFFKNIPITLIVFVFIYSGLFTKEYESGTLILILTKGLSRYKVVLAKFFVMFTVWTIGYWSCFGITYGYNSYFWDNSIATGLIPATIYWWIFGMWVICLVVLFSVLSKSHIGVLLGTGCSVFGVYLISLFPKIWRYTPTVLMEGSSLLIGTKTVEDYGIALFITILVSIACMLVSITLMNKKQL
ncbi:TPA: ABC transporter permease [Streptococcus suis]|uniref:ABC transporter permease subunit n=1 Tax=Streptococcus suis TaxID=1307 RepID=UPI001ABE08E5|nr:ABC transporter permease subunit [Streptococcus suis]MBO4109348.1 ABC transporter permease [Streptococcus suis]HEM3612601.1 ABC transporter permease [Streptococcus suis]HEM3627283.1 ABC transporter permease [Streptococcus suis]HEM3640361.1 ABC transporter permease [Streptococcus suis]HEM3641837.1 ABC transporter permease [Streptococcus suis]